MVFVSIFIQLFLQLQSPSYGADVKAWSDWEKEYASYCNSDNKGQFCDNLKNSDGSWVQPSESVKKILKELYPEIEKASKTYNIKNESIIAAILSENSLNVSLNDDIQNWLVKNKVFKNAKIPLVGYFSIGFSQVTVSAAAKVEKSSAKAEGRSVRTEEEIAKELLNPVSAINYTAAIIKNNQDIYAKNGFNISDRPDIIASLHSLGEPEKYAARAKADKRQPKPNFMGIFASKYQADIMDIAKTNEISPVEKKTNIADQVIVEKPVVAKNSNGMPLLSSVPLCMKNGAGQASEYKKNISYFEGEQSASLKGDDKYYKISESVDCNLENWVLVKTPNGAEGWIKENKLDAKKELNLILNSKNTNKVCSSKTNCEAKIKKINDQVLSSKNNRIQLKVGSIEQYGEPNMSSYNADACIAGWGREKVVTSKDAKGNVNEKSLGQFVNTINNFLERTNKAYKLLESAGKYVEADKLTLADSNKVWQFDNNPYSIIDLSPIQRVIESSKKCINEKVRCRMDFETIEKTLNNSNVENPSLDDILLLNNALTATDKVQVLDKVSVVPLPKEVEDNINYFLENCKVKPEYKKTAKFIETIANYKNVYDPEFVDAKILDKKFWKEKVDSCDYINFLDGKKNGIQNESIYCKSKVDAKFTTEYALGGSRTSNKIMDVSLLTKLLNNDSSKDSYLETAVKDGLWVMQNVGSVAEFPSEINCAYDPFKTSEMISQISKIECVDKIYISDLWVLKNLSKRMSNLYYMPSMNSNDFEVQLKDECK
jgi:hypothetical protein